MGSSDSRPEHPEARHFTEINSRALRSQTSNPTHPRPTNTSRTATSTSNRTPNYMYQVPQDENIHLVRRNTDATSVSTVGASSSSTVSNPSSSSVIASTTVSRPVNVMPPSSSTVTTAKPPVQQGSTTSSYKSSSASNSSPVTASNTSMPSSVSSVTNTKSPGSTAVSNNTSSMNSKFEKINLQNANNSMSDLTASGSVDSSSLNNRNSASKENLNSGHRKNAYQRQRNNNANGDSQAGHRSQFNNRRGAGNRQPHNRNHRQRFESPNDNELTRDNRANRRHDSGNRQNPRNRNPRNNFSDGRSTENRNPRNRFTDDGPTENSGDEKTKEVHDAFMKKLVGTFPPNHDKFRGLFCAACNHYEVFIGKRPKVKHIDTHMHNSKLRENPSIKSMSCSSCKIMLHCDVKFLVAHKKSEIHIFISDQKRRADASSAEPTSNDVDNSVKGDNTLNLKGEIKQKFLERLNLSSEINDYSFYCHLCEQWFTNHVIWDEHLKNQHNDDEKKLMNMTFKHCQACKLMMCGSNLLSLFHTDAEEHEKFRTFLNIPSVESDDDDVDDRDDVSTTSSAAARDRNSQNPVYLVLKNLPPVTSRRDIFAYFKDFGRLENWTMNPIGENTAVVQFAFGSVAENIINSNFPLEIHGSRIEAGLQYL